MSTMNTGDVTRRIGLTVTSELIKELGFEAVGQDKRATLWAQADYPAMCEALAAWVNGRKNVPMQPKPVRTPPAGKPKATTASASNDDDDL